MLDFVTINSKPTRSGIEVEPKFIMCKSSDLMIRGGDFYAIWDEDRGLWSTDEQDVIRLIDKQIDEYCNNNSGIFEGKNVYIRHMWDADSGAVDKWHRYCQRQCRDRYVMLDEKIVWSNDPTNKKDYASKRLPYPLEKGSIEGYETLISTLYSKEERHKIEWAIGSIVSGDSKFIQKFMVLYGSAGTGKSTILNIIQKLFTGYYSVFDAKALGSSSNAFALEAFKTNPLVAIQHDGDLSRIEDNTRLNSLVSHELMTVNEKFKATYTNDFKCFLFMGTNRPVKITDAKSGLIRRLIDVTPSGDKLSLREYNKAMKKVDFELGAIAQHCLDVYLNDPNAYDDYIPVMMLGASNDFYNYIIDSYHVFIKEDGTTLNAAWAMYNTYCDEAKVSYPMSKRTFKEELRNYFHEFIPQYSTGDGSRIRNYYKGFRTEKFEDTKENKIEVASKSWLTIESLTNITSIFDKECSECAAQYASENGTPFKKWANATTKLSDIDTSKLHFTKPEENHIVIDFDIKDENGNKSLEKNIEAAAKWPPTYAEVSKSGCGIHLHYIYSGDVSKLSRIFDDNIEIKVFSGNSSLRRMLTKCNDLNIATISSGLPLKGEDNMIEFTVLKNEKAIRTVIKKALNKEYHADTTSNINFINKTLDDAYEGGLKYDVSDMKSEVLAFAANSTNQSDYCIKTVSKMKFKSEETSVGISECESPIAFYDVEVFPNLFLVNWKLQGKDNPVVRLINPKPSDIEELLKFRLVGFNCRRYDNHILYGCLIGYNNQQLYDLSSKIVYGDRNAFFGEAYNLSYTDVYDFAAKKQSLKKWEIELGIHHQELGLPWDQPVDESLWNKVAEYCDNDVIATEAVFDHISGDFVARKILAQLANGTVNDTTNSLSTKIIFGSNRNPQSQFNYRFMGDMSEPIQSWTFNDELTFYDNMGDDYTVFNEDNRPIFPGYTFEAGKSLYRGEEVGEGGYVYSEPGMYGNVALLDVASMHPSSIIAEELFGPVYTQRFKDIRDARVAIKHEDYETARTMLDGALTEFTYSLENGTADFESGDLAQALKIVINSIYGLTAARFPNAFRDPRNIDNIVAKRGALFMINLKHEVQARGFTVAHVKTDSIKIPDATPEIIQFVMDYGKMYEYTFEHEATYDRMCLVNDAVYIAKYKDAKECNDIYGYIPEKNAKKEHKWDATGKQFAVPYLFKKLFSKEDIIFEDMCESFSVSKGDLYLDLNENLPDVSMLEKEFHVISQPYTMKTTGEHMPNGREPERQEELKKLIEEGHCYKFVGRVGQFCPILPGNDGGILYRVSDGKNYSAAGSLKPDKTPYRWLEAETVKTLGLENAIDKSFYEKLINDAVDSISEYGDFEWFVSDDPYICENPIVMHTPIYDDGIPPWEDSNAFCVR